MTKMTQAHPCDLVTPASGDVDDEPGGARFDIVTDRAPAMGADAVGSQFTELGRDVQVLPLQPRGLRFSAALRAA